MKGKKLITKNVTAFLLCAVLSAVALLILSCAPLFEPSSGTSAETGRVVLTVSTGATGPARTILPTATPVFSRYKLVFSRSSYTDIVIDNAADVAGSGFSRELAAGTWTVTVTAYRKFTISGTETEYQAAEGHEDITVSAGQTTEETVSLAPLPATGTEPGIFTYKVNLPDGAAAKLTFGDETPVSLTPGTEVSVEKAPGYYNLFISAAKGSLIAGLSEKVHIYAGLESKAEFTFANTDFTAAVYLAGTISLPGGVSIASGNIGAYTGQDYSGQIGSTDAAASWVVGIPVTHIDTTVYLKAVLSGADGKTYIATGNTPGPVTEKGVRDIVLTYDPPPADVSGLGGTAGNGQVALNWTDPTDTDLDHIEITWTPDGITPVSVTKGTQIKTITGLTNGISYIFTIKAVDAVGNKSAGISSTGLKPLAPTGVITVDFTGLPQDDNITLAGVQDLSWAADTTLTVTVSETFDAYRWDLDGVTLVGETTSSLTLHAGELSVKQHTLTVFVTKDSVEYTKRVTFTVAP
jgi:hypothetical protein